jgi:hypothetical protein
LVKFMNEPFVRSNVDLSRRDGFVTTIFRRGR